MLTRAIFAAIVLVACRDTSDPGFEIVQVPRSAYATVDASVDAEGGVAARDGGEPVMLCIPKPEEKKEGDDDESSDCPSEYEGRTYDEKATTRHRAKDDEGNVCCYRKATRH
jgi:hypothetical protein